MKKPGVEFAYFLGGLLMGVASNAIESIRTKREIKVQVAQQIAAEKAKENKETEDKEGEA